MYKRLCKNKDSVYIYIYMLVSEVGSHEIQNMQECAYIYISKYKYIYIHMYII